MSISKRPPPPPIPKMLPRPHHKAAPRIIVYHPAPKAAVLIHKRRGGKASPHRHVALPVALATLRPISLAINTDRGVHNGGAGVGAGIGVGESGNAGMHTGIVGIGHGNAANTEATPCGFVEFKPTSQEIRHGKQYVWLQIIVHLNNGEVLTDTLRWPFIYAGDADNPWSRRNIDNSDFQTTMQLPPPGFDLEGSQNRATVLAVKQTGPDGFTLLDPCPEQQPL